MWGVGTFGDKMGFDFCFDQIGDGFVLAHRIEHEPLTPVLSRFIHFFKTWSCNEYAVPIFGPLDLVAQNDLSEKSYARNSQILS